MKKILAVLFVLLITQIVSAQRMVEEYGIIGSDDESGKMDSFLSELNNEPNSSGLIVIYAGFNKERLGNILAHVEGIKRYFYLRKFDQKRILFLIAEGKAPFFKELWIVKKNENFPKFKEVDLNLKGIKEKYLYAERCIVCEPVVDELRTDSIKIKMLIKLLKANKEYSVLIIISIGFYGFENAGYWRKELVIRNGIENNRIKIKDEKGKHENSTAYFYIIPKSTKK